MSAAVGFGPCIDIFIIDDITCMRTASLLVCFALKLNSYSQARSPCRMAHGDVTESLLTIPNKRMLMTRSRSSKAKRRERNEISMLNSLERENQANSIYQGVRRQKHHGSREMLLPMGICRHL